MGQASDLCSHLQFIPKLLGLLPILFQNLLLDRTGSQNNRKHPTKCEDKTNFNKSVLLCPLHNPSPPWNITWWGLHSHVSRPATLHCCTLALDLIPNLGLYVNQLIPNWNSRKCSQSCAESLVMEQSVVRFYLPPSRTEILLGYCGHKPKKKESLII